MQINNGQGEVVVAKDASLRSMIKKNIDMFKMALPKTITAERMMRIAMTAVTMNPKLATCSQSSFFGALLTATQLGLEVNTPLGQAYLIPYDTKKGMLCQFQLGYQGALELAYRSRKFKRIKAVVVHKGDYFEYSYGLTPQLEHKPTGTDEPTHVYALYETESGGVDFEVWTWEQVMRHGQKYSKSFSNSPWKTAPEEMAKKTVLKSLLKYAPKAVELNEAVVADEGIINKNVILDTGDIQVVSGLEYPDEIENDTEPNSSVQQEGFAVDKNPPNKEVTQAFGYTDKNTVEEKKPKVKFNQNELEEFPL